MEYRTIEEIQRVAELHPEAPVAESVFSSTAAREMSRSERLERWAALLRDHPGRLGTLHGTEYRSAELRDHMRADDTALSVAAADPVLREQGLVDDTYGQGKRFFELTDLDMHSVLCDCHLGGTVSGRAASLQVAGLVKSQMGFFQRLLQAFDRRLPSL